MAGVLIGLAVIVLPIDRRAMLGSTPT